jgi:hypothetical protein
MGLAGKASPPGAAHFDEKEREGFSPQRNPNPEKAATETKKPTPFSNKQDNKTKGE